MLRLADPRFGADAVDAVARVLASGHLTQGPVVQEFEAAVAELCGVPHAIATTSATTALTLALAALDVGPGDEVIAADFTYPATGNVVLQQGATLRLADVDPGTFCVRPDAVADLVTERTRAVVAVDVFGLPADYVALERMLDERGVALICDAACSLGGAIGERPTGSFGRVSCFSFHPRKSLTTGEGGMVTTADAALADRIRSLRNHGSERRDWRATFVEAGFNARMSDLNAAVGLVQAAGYPGVVERRRALAARLTEALRPLDGVRPQAVPPGFRHPYQAYVVVLDAALDRDALIVALRERGVESTLGTYAMHAEPAFERACSTRPGDLQASFALRERTLALPLHERLEDSDVDRVAEALADAIAATPPRAATTVG